MQQFQTGQRVVIRAMDENGEVLPQTLYGFAAVVGSYPEINPEAADKIGRENEYLLATLNKDLEVNLFVGYSHAKCLTLVEGEPLVEGLLDELEECRDELFADETGEVCIVVRDDVDGNEFSPEDYEGDLQLTRVKLDGEIVGVYPTESLAVAANNLRRLVSYSSLLSLVEGLEQVNPKQDATETERATYIPETLPNKLSFGRDDIVALGYQLIDFADYRRKEDCKSFKEAVENIPAIQGERFKPAYFESPFQIISELKEAIIDLGDESRLTAGSDVELEFEPFIANVCEWEDFAFDPTFGMEEDEDDEEEEDHLDDEFEPEDASDEDDDDDAEEAGHGVVDAEKAQSIQDLVQEAVEATFENDESVVVVGTQTVFNNVTAAVTILFATAGADIEALKQEFDGELTDAEDDEEEEDDEEDFEEEDDDDFAAPQESAEIIALTESLVVRTREELERICTMVDLSHKGFTDKKIRERLVAMAKKAPIFATTLTKAIAATAN